MGGGLIFYVVRIYGTSIIEFVIGVLSRVNGLGGIVRGIIPLKFTPLQFRDLEKSKELEGWIESWWGT